MPEGKASLDFHRIHRESAIQIDEFRRTKMNIAALIHFLSRRLSKMEEKMHFGSVLVENRAHRAVFVTCRSGTDTPLGIVEKCH
jgi:hypothetical protein